MIRLVRNHPAIKYDDYLIISDLHIGIEKEYYDKGYSIPSQTNKMIKEIIRMKGRTKKLVILGDLKHNITTTTNYEEQEIRKLITKLRKHFSEIILIKGNHDNGIDYLIKPEKELIIGDYALIHGHTVSSKALSKRIIAGHMHPVYAYRNHLGVIQREKCFIISDKVIIIPALTNLSAGSDELVKPLKKLITNEEVILLNHTKVK